MNESHGKMQHAPRTTKHRWTTSASFMIGFSRARSTTHPFQLERGQQLSLFAYRVGSLLVRSLRKNSELVLSTVVESGVVLVKSRSIVDVLVLVSVLSVQYLEYCTVLYSYRYMDYAYPGLGMGSPVRSCEL